MLKNILSPTLRLRGLLALLLLAVTSTAFGQATTLIYGLVNVYRTTTAVPVGTAGNTVAIPSYPKGTQTLISIDPSTGLPFGQGNLNLSPLIVPISGITPGQILVGIDVRPSNGVLYGLGYDTLSNATQLYRLLPLVANGNASTPNTNQNIISGAIATAVGAAVTLPLGNISPAATSKRIGFDFNPVADAVRLVSANGRNYRLNPNTGALAATDGNLVYTGANVSVPVVTQTGPASTAPPTSAGIGAVAYTNSQLAATSTQLYAYDELDRGILSQVPDPNSGVLTNPIAGSFFITGSASGQGPYIITPRLVALDIDFYYNRTTAQNTAYLLEVTADQPGGYHASNLYTLNTANNLASRVNSIFANPPVVPVSNPLINNTYALDAIDIAAAINAPLIWSGFVSDEWTNANNWIPNRVPTSADDVLIPGTYTPGSPLNTSTFPGTTPTPNQPVVRVAGQVANSIRVNTVSTLTLVSPGTLSVGTDISNSGTVISNGGALTVGGNFASVNGALNSTSGSVTVSGSFINTTSTITSSGGTLTVGGSLTNTGGTITGNGGTFTVGGSFSNANAASTLTLNSGSTFNLGGNFTNTGGTVGGSGTGRLALTGSVVQTIGGTVSSFPNLTVGTAGATTTGPVNILSTGGVILTGNVAIGTGQAFTLLSTASGTAFVVNNGAAVATGAVTVQRYINTAINAGVGYRHYSSPVSNTTVADFTTTGFTPTVNATYNTSANPPSVSPFPTVFSYDQSRLSLNNSSPEFDKGFLSPTALTDLLIPTFGYTVNIPGTALVDFVGTLNNGNISRIGLGRGTQTLAGYYLTGNPYPSAINFNTVYSASSGLENALYVFKSTTQYAGTYASYVNNIGTNGGSNIIPIAQGFFVRAVASTNGALNFTNSARLTTADNTPFQRTTADGRTRLGITLHNAAVANQTYVYFEQGATVGFDADFDAHYLPATHGLDLATETSTEALSINGQPALTAATTVPLRLHAATAGTYTLAVDELANLPAGYHAYLRDALTSTYTDLATTPSVSLTLAPADAATGRYAIVFGTATPLATAPAATAQLVSLYPNPAHGTVSLLLPQALRTNTATEVTVVDNLGRTVLSRTLGANATTLDLPLDGLSTGIYSVQAQTNAGVVAKRLVVE